MEVGTSAASGATNLLSQLLSIFMTIVLAIMVTLLGTLILKKLLSKLSYNKSLKNGLNNPNKVCLFIKIPPSSDKAESSMEEFLRTLHRVLPNNTNFSLELVSSEQFLRFYICLPKDLKSLLESQLYAQYPDAEIEEVPDYLSSIPENTALAQIDFKRSSVHPFNTYKSLEENLLRNLSALLSKSEPGERAVLQLALKRVGSKWWERGFKSWYFKSFGKKYNEEDTPTPAHSKLSQDLYLGKLRLAYTARDKATAEGKLNTLITLFKGIKGSHNELKKKTFLFGRNLNSELQARVFESPDLWSPAELSTIYHFPYKNNLVSNVVSTTSKRSPGPDVLPAFGVVNSQEVSFFGQTNYRNERKVFGIKRIDRRRHMYVIGKTGSGKSRLLELLLISDIKEGYGCCLLDPHGDLADELLMFVPRERLEDVVYVNPADTAFPVGFNPLEPVSDPEIRQHLSTFFIAIFKKLFAFNWNPRMEHLIRYMTLALLETPDSNILGIPRLLSDTAFRQRVIMQIQDPVVKSFWTNEFSAWNERFANDAVIPILNKVGQFVANPIVRNMVGQRKNSLDFGKFMDEGKIVILNISKGKLGEDNIALLGSMFITKIQQAALARAKIPEEQRRDFYFYVDEFQNFATDAFSSILSEARKYRLNLTVAHQYMAQLPEDVKATTFGNVGTIVSFAVGGDDANYLAKEFAPTFSAEDLINLNMREMYVKMSIDGKLAPPFSAQTIDVPKPTFDYSTEIVNASKMKYGKNRVQVENEIARWSQSVNPIDNSSGDKDNFPEPII
ncbi:MAG: DUF87 domain-containing protein [bacterium]|nr:DUF87 domain-containing protein [bacterium]